MRQRRRAFTLFELILAIALSAVLLGLIGMAINLYLTRISMSRDRVEEAQLARSVLSMIADDLRASAIYQSQDVSDVAQLMAASASFDVDSIDDPRSGSSGSGNNSTSAPGGTSAPSGAGTSTSISSLSSALSSGAAGATGGDASSGAGSSTSQNYENEMPLGVNGGIGELYVDIERLPRGDELFGTLTGYTNAPMAVANTTATTATGASRGSTSIPSDLKTVRYFVREGDLSNTNGLAATSLAPELQGYAGGLVRQEIPRPARVFAEQVANAGVLESGQVLIAPEVLQIEFRYFDGQQVVDVWDMVERQSLPLAVEVRIWLTSPSEVAGASTDDARLLLNTAREYRQTVFLPLAKLSQTGAGSGTGGSSTGSTSSDTSAFGTSSSSSPSGSSSTGSTSFGSGNN